MTPYEAAVLLDVEENFAFAPHTRLVDGKFQSVTLCNAYASVFCAVLDVELPPVMANKQYLWMMSHPAEWEPVTKADALRLVNEERAVVVAVAQHPEHGHIAGCVESPLDDLSHLYVTAAGMRCYRRTRLESSFGFLNPVFFRHLTKEQSHA